MAREKPPKYQPLGDYLAGQPAAVEAVTLTFVQIEALIGEPLPAGAATATWWTNAPSTHYGRAWLAAGWRVTGRHLREEPPTITFTRIDSTPSPPA